MLVIPESDEEALYQKVLYLRDYTKPQSWRGWMESMTWFTNPPESGRYRFKVDGYGDATVSVEVRARDQATRKFLVGSWSVGDTADVEVPAGQWDVTFIYVRKPPGPAAGLSIAMEHIPSGAAKESGQRT
jgi:hypothetical protein